MIVKSRQLLQNMVLNTQAVRLDTITHVPSRLVNCMDASNYEDVFFKMVVFPAKSTTDKVNFGDNLHIEQIKFHILQKFEE